MKTCIKSFVDDFVRSEFMANWHAENDNEGYGMRRERFERVNDAAEHGAYGATHYEIINDWRAALDSYIADYRGKRTHSHWCELDRFKAAIYEHFDAIELWHENNGSLHDEIG